MNERICYSHTALDIQGVSDLKRTAMSKLKAISIKLPRLAIILFQDAVYV